MSELIQLGKIPSSPTKQEEYEMFKVYFMLPNGRAKNKQRHFIASHYYNYIHYILNQRKAALSTMPYDDTFQQGYIGLLEGIENFDIEAGFRFTSYVHFYIFRSVARELETNETQVKIPGNTYFKMTDPEFTTTYYGKECYAPAFIKLDDVVGNNDHPLSSLFRCPDAEEVMHGTVDKFFNQKMLDDALLQLNDTDANIIKMYYGYDGVDNYTLLDIAHRLGLSRERVRQRRNAAIDSIRRVINTKLAIAA